MLDLNLIRIDGGTQARVALNQETVAEYAEAYRQGAKFPPVTVFFDGTDRWLADGFHRYFAAVAAGLTQILENITPGTKRDAVLFSLSANAAHGLRRTNADKRKAVEMLLADAEWAEWSDRDIAKQCGVTHPFVASVRRPRVVTVTTPKAKAGVEVAANSDDPKAASPVESVDSPAPAPQEAPSQAFAEVDEPEDDGPDAAEMAANAAAAADDLAALQKLMDADDKLATAIAEVKRLNAVNAQIQQRMNGLMNEKAELVRKIKDLQRKLERAERASA